MPYTSAQYAAAKTRLAAFVADSRAKVLAALDILMMGRSSTKSVEQYGVIGADATANTATINAAFADHASWSRLRFPGVTIPVNDDLVIPECSGKVIRGTAANPFGTVGNGGLSPSGTRIVQNGTNKNILRLDGWSRAVDIKDISLAYGTLQATDGKAAVLFNMGADASQCDLHFENISIEKAHRGFYSPLQGSNAFWNIDLNKIRIWNTAHTAIEFKGVGNPMSTFRQVFISNTPGGPVPTGPAIYLWNGEFVLEGVDIEGWNNLAYRGFGATTTMLGLHVEHHSFTTGGDGDGLTNVLRSDEGPLTVFSMYFAMVDPAGTVSTAYASIFGSFGVKGSVNLQGLVTAVPVSLTANMAILDGDDLSRASISNDIVQNGKVLPKVGTFSFWPNAGYSEARPPTAHASTHQAGGGDALLDPVKDAFGTPNTAFEFASTSLTGLAAVGATTTEDAHTTVPNNYFVKPGGSGWCGRAAATPATPFTAIAKLSDHTIRGNFSAAALFVGEATPGKMLCAGPIHTASGWVPEISVWSSPAVFSSALITYTLNMGAHCPMYIAIRVNSNTSVDYFQSMNGQLWRPLSLAHNGSLTIGSVGIAAKNDGGGQIAAAFDFLRIWNSALVLPGS